MLYNISSVNLIVRWSKIASHLPGRTDNEIKNVWNTHLKKRLMKTLHSEAKLDGSCANSPSSSSSTSVVLSHAYTINDRESKNEKANMIIEKEETTKSCSPTSSYASNLSQIHEISSPNNVDMDWIFQFNEEPFSSTTTRKAHDGVIEIPLECDDVDIWDKLDVPCASPPPPNSNDHSKQDNEASSQLICQGLSEFECQKWFKYFENELLGV